PFPDTPRCARSSATPRPPTKSRMARSALARSTLEKRRVPASRATSRDLPRLGGALGSSYGLHVPLGVGNKLVRFWSGATFEHFSGLDANCYLNIETAGQGGLCLA